MNGNYCNLVLVLQSTIQVYSRYFSLLRIPYFLRSCILPRERVTRALRSWIRGSSVRISLFWYHSLHLLDDCPHIVAVHGDSSSSYRCELILWGRISYPGVLAVSPRESRDGEMMRGGGWYRIIRHCDGGSNPVFQSFQEPGSPRHFVPRDDENVHECRAYRRLQNHIQDGVSSPPRSSRENYRSRDIWIHNS